MTSRYTMRGSARRCSRSTPAERPATSRSGAACIQSIRARVGAHVYISHVLWSEILRCGANGSARAMYKKKGGESIGHMRRKEFIHSVVLVFLVTSVCMLLVVASLCLSHYMAYGEFAGTYYP
jgi:hypothetical protein